MQVTFYTYGKEINSTSQPSGAGASYDCVLKAPCTIITPVLELNLGGSSPGSPFKFNYAWIEEFERFYRIENWEFNLGLWVAYLSVDVLASWKEDIGASSQYVVRSAATFDGTVPDGLYPGTGAATVASLTLESKWQQALLSDTGTFVVALAGNNINYYAFTRGGLTSFLEYVFSNEYLDELYGFEWADEFKQLKATANPMQYINSVRWFPMTISGTAVGKIPVGWVECPGGGAALVNDKIPRMLDFQFGRVSHPQSGRGSFLNNSPYSRYTIFYPPFGSVVLDSEAYANSTGVKGQIYIDVRTGMAVLDLYYTHTTGPDTLAFHTSAPFAVEFQLAHLTSQTMGWGDIAMSALNIGIPYASGLAGSALSAAGGDIQGGLSQIGSTISKGAQDYNAFLLDGLASKSPLLNCTGSPGGSAGLMGQPRLDGIFTLMANDDNAHRGRPLCMTKTISSIPGYIQCADVHLEIPAFQEELDAIYSFMMGGFYYE